jgi:hypothetical protein
MLKGLRLVPERANVRDQIGSRGDRDGGCFADLAQPA